MFGFCVFVGTTGAGTAATPDLVVEAQRCSLHVQEAHESPNSSDPEDFFERQVSKVSSASAISSQLSRHVCFDAAPAFMCQVINVHASGASAGSLRYCIGTYKATLFCLVHVHTPTPGPEAVQGFGVEQFCPCQAACCFNVVWF